MMLTFASANKALKLGSKLTQENRSFKLLSLSLSKFLFKFRKLKK